MLCLSLLVGLALLSTDHVLAAPSCANGMTQADACISKCKNKFGWPGFAMGTDRWGAVAVPYEGSIDTVVAKACGESTSQGSPVSGNLVSQPGMAAPSPYSPPAEPTSSAIVTSATSSSSSSTVSTTSSTQSSSSQASPDSATPQAPPPTDSPSPSPSPSSTPAPPPPPPASSQAPPPAPSPSSSDSSSSSGDEQQYLTAHNTIRAQHGASPLTWSDDLAGKAQQWANGCVFQHSGGSLGPFGENLAAGNGADYDIAAAVKSWTDEVSQYDASNPQPSHFTQVVWKATTQVGCAEQSCTGILGSSLAKFFVCEYQAQGNVIGQFAQNVQA